MGKVRTSLVKRTARELLAKYPDLFTEDFQHNKKVVSQLTVWSSKKLRNQVAGYVTSLVKLQKKRQQLKATEEGQATQ
ncbi:MAG: 30S ribosomal protein S17e [Acidilobus sp.]|nr:30S ribosomal protein S17e [Acidilobus sp.]MCG2890971.1 30S ribosomal protein S17e [Acidilobus sp.]